MINYSTFAAVETSGGSREPACSCRLFPDLPYILFVRCCALTGKHRVRPDVGSVLHLLHLSTVNTLPMDLRKNLSLNLHIISTATGLPMLSL